MKRRLLALLLTAASVLALAGCTDPAAAGKTTVKLWVYGDTTTIAAYNAMGDAFNATAGEEEGIYYRYCCCTHTCIYIYRALFR